jgi:transmembrane sensor
MENTQRLTELLEAYLKNSLKGSEVLELQQLLIADEDVTATATAFQQIIPVYEAGEYEPSETWDRMINHILHQPADKSVTKIVHRIHFLKTAWFRWAAAIIIILTAALLWNTQKLNKTPTNTAVVNTSGNEVLPGSNKAILTLSNGEKVALNAQASETITDGAISIKNNNGHLVYAKGEKMAMNTMTTPRGGQYQLSLSDGSKAWLNAASSITFPTVFNNNKREVIITGEVYFEIAADRNKPFFVKTPTEEIAVLGTSFNINAYPDESDEKTSLVDGKIKINQTILSPGQAYANGKIIKTNIDQDIAWRKGGFNFNNMSLTAVFRQLSRWYNIDIKYAGKIPNKEINGEMGRDLNLSQVLKALNGMDIHAKLEGNVLTILEN